MRHQPAFSRRQFLEATLAAGEPLAGLARAAAPPPRLAGKAPVAITLDLEMSRNFPAWEDTHWDYEKGNLNAETKRYAVEAARRVRAHGGVVHFFAVGRVFEQESVAWLKDLVLAGHPVGNHTYDHVNVKARRPQDIQFRFNRAPWLIDGRKPHEVVRENVRLTGAAMKARLGVEAAGFRTPGGFHDGLADRPDVQGMLRELGFRWVSSKYPAHPLGKPGAEPTEAVLEGIVKAQAQAQPFVYPKGLVEVPMSPVSDITAFRGGRWKLAWFLRALRRAVSWTIEQGAVFDFLGHPSCLYVTDPKFEAIELICALVKEAGDRAALADLDAIARRANP
jgi:peptidoglycan/xylan/chitin deacetylase (PgdA/CDA1 family)